MKRYIVLLTMLLSLFCCHAQSTTRNYIKTRTYRNAEATAFMDNITYFDGLGRPEQTISVKASPANADLVDYNEYDEFGRDSVQWLPVTHNGNGAYTPLTEIKSITMPLYSEGNPYTRITYDALDRPATQTGPGSAWESHPVIHTYQLNAANEVKAFKIYGQSSTITFTEYYEPGTLFKKETRDEDNNVVWEYIDKNGNVVLIRNSAVNADTYYLYNRAGQLRYVLPPNVADALEEFYFYDLSHDAIKKFAYYYEYDNKGNCSKKILPGGDSIVMKYDNASRLVFSQDGNQRSKNEWTFSLYDALGRPVVTGICLTQTFAPFEELVVKATYNGGTVLGGYTVTPALSGSVRLMSVHYYDNYNFINTLTATEKPKMAMVTEAGYDSAFPSNTAPNARGLSTGTRTYRLDDPSKYTVSTFYYDHRGRVVQTHASNDLGGFDDTYFAYTFTGKVKQHQLAHSAPGKTTQTEVYTYSYDHTERLLSVTHKLNTAAQVTLAQYTYDGIGRILTKKLAAETSTYNYNVRSWLTQINGTKFNQTLAYNTPVNGITPTTALYNGNIGAMKWKAGDESTERGYKFTYDNLSRLTAAAYGEGASITSNPDRFNETVAYNDKMGNILTLQRRGKLDGSSVYGVMDNLTYTYTGNQLTKVSDAATPSITYANAFHFVDRANVANEYTYDANGNLTKDLNKNITSISYNALNLPSVITFGDGNTITYGYDAAGSKLSVAYTEGGSTVKTEYAGNKVYKNGTLSMILTQEGYLTLAGTTPTYYYYLKDHQGNNRVVINQSGAVQQVNHYYPFGGLFGEGLQASNQPYKYNGKELDRFQNLDMYDYGLRFYDPQLARWHTIDPAAELMFSWSPYNYCYGNPIRFEDKDGAIPLETIWDVANVAMGVTSMVNNIKQGNYSAALADAGGALVDVAAVVVPYVPGGASTAIKAARAADKAVDAAKAAKTVDKVTDTKKAATMVENAKNGKAFEKKVGGTLDGAKAEQVTIEAADGTKTKVDFAQNKDGKISLTEAKGSDTAPLTKNQKSAHPQIEQRGGTVRGNKGQDIGLPAGTKIPPTKVEIVRPDDL